jgi:hypothetical protein
LRWLFYAKAGIITFGPEGELSRVRAASRGRDSKRTLRLGDVSFVGCAQRGEAG